VLIDVAMAQNVGGEDHGKGAVGEGKGIDRSGTDWPCALGGCPSAGLLVSVKPEQRAIGVARGQLGEEPACPATRIQDRPVPRFERYSMTGKRQQVSVIGGKPPHLILDAVELVIFGTFHVRLGALFLRSRKGRTSPQSALFRCGTHAKGKGARFMAGPVPMWASTARRLAVALRSPSQPGGRDGQARPTARRPSSRPGRRGGPAASGRNYPW
jgi:hypothetical protein